MSFATDVYRQVIGQFNFQMGAVVGLLLLLPAVISFAVDRMVQRRQVALLSARAVPLEPKPRAVIDRLFFRWCRRQSLASCSWFWAWPCSARSSSCGPTI